MEETKDGVKKSIGMAVCYIAYRELTNMLSQDVADVCARQVIRGNSVVMLEALERIGGDDRGGHR